MVYRVVIGNYRAVSQDILAEQSSALVKFNFMVVRVSYNQLNLTLRNTAEPSHCNRTQLIALN